MREQLPQEFWKENWQVSDFTVKDRTHGYIGGSDVSTIMGQNPFKSPLMLWYEKKGLWKAEETQPMVIGREIEEFIIQKYEREENVQVYSLPAILGEPFVVHVDGIVIDPFGSLKVVEIKNIGAFNKHWGHYYWQVLAYMHALGLQEADLAMLIGGNDFVIKHFQYNPEDAQRMLTEIDKFLKMLNGDVPPAPSGIENETDMLLELLNYEGEQVYPDLDSAYSRLSEIREAKKQLETEETEIKNRILELMNEKQVNVMVGQNVIAHVKTIKRKVLNTEGFKDELEKYYKEIEYKQLNFKAKKGGKKNGNSVES